MIRTELIKLGFKITSKTLPNPLILAFEQNGGRKTHPYNTRNKSLLNIQKHTKNLYNTSFMCKALTKYTKALTILKQKKNSAQPWEGSTETFNCRVLVGIPKL